MNEPSDSLPNSTQKIACRADYRPPTYRLPRVHLTVWLDRQATRVEARIRLERDETHYKSGEPLLLHGRNLTLESLTLDGRLLVEHKDYRLHQEGLELLAPPSTGDLVSRVILAPDANFELEGLYASGDMLCTQCEAEGFRKIAYWLDRPDLLSVYTVKLIAKTREYPVLLANGNCIERGTSADGMHFAVWRDPFPKPSYLFALVAGSLTKTADRFTTRSGRRVELEIWTRAADAGKTGHAMLALKRAMAWDEAVFGLEYDLDVYMIVAVSDFNMGAMENKGLNIFNSKYILADPQTTTDAGYQAIESVIAHEYFHNWTGNRVTCRDWFQLSLKEGLTVFRDQQFSADMNSAAVVRISDVSTLRSHQFPEDSGPTAHPVRPDSYLEINNFYTMTVYSKGAEVVRMYQTLFGVDGFGRGMDLYFRRHDGQAVTCDDFRAAMADANGADLTQFELWYSQAGTPVVRVTDRYDSETKTYRLTFTQTCPPTPGQTIKQPFLIPIAMGLLAADGTPLPMQLETDMKASAQTRVLCLTESCQSFTFHALPEAPIPSLLRGFSAPVKLERDWTKQELSVLSAYDSDPFTRWEAGQTILISALLAAVDQAATILPGMAMPEKLPDDIKAWITALLAPFVEREIPAGADPAFAALCLNLPSETYLSELVPAVHPDRIYQARHGLHLALARHFTAELLAVVTRFAETGPFQRTPAAVGRRRLRNTALRLLTTSGHAKALALAADQAKTARAMTNRYAALGMLADSDHPERRESLAKFHADFSKNALVLDKWFAVQAVSRRPDTLEQVKKLLCHPDYDAKNPNKAYALVGNFAAGNRLRFHASNGLGYSFLAGQVLASDCFNAKLAARLVAPLVPWKRFEPIRQNLMQVQLERIRTTPGLSRDVTEIVEKALQA